MCKFANALIRLLRKKEQLREVVDAPGWGSTSQKREAARVLAGLDDIYELTLATKRKPETEGPKLLDMINPRKGFNPLLDVPPPL